MQQGPEVAGKIALLRAHVRESFGKVVMGMMALPRYRHQSLADLQHLVLEPLIRDRIATAYPKAEDAAEKGDIVGMAIWASVSEEADAKIREQIKSGTWPVRLKAEEWNSGQINWLLDVIAADQQASVSVLRNFKQVIKEGDLRLHPVIAKLVDAETLEKMGAAQQEGDRRGAASAKVDGCGTSSRNHIVTSARVIGSVSGGRGILLVGWDLFQQVGQHRGVADVACGDAGRAYLQSVRVHSEMQLAPKALL